MKEFNESKEFFIFASILIAVIAIIFFVLFGIAGLRVSLGILLISLPIYLILNNFELEENEKIVFSILLGITLFPSLVYILGLAISFRISILIVFIILIISAFLLRKYQPKK